MDAFPKDRWLTRILKNAQACPSCRRMVHPQNLIYNPQGHILGCGRCTNSNGSTVFRARIQEGEMT